jgi:Leucine-rich repeat (LRR) protein
LARPGSYLDLNNNEISDLTPLSGIGGWTTLYLRNNNITDLAPLAANSDLLYGASTYLEGNPIDCVAQAENIQALEETSLVSTDCP